MCIAGEDIWHLDCERYKAAAGIRTGKVEKKEKVLKELLVTIFLSFYS